MEAVVAACMEVANIVGSAMDHKQTLARHHSAEFGVLCLRTAAAAVVGGVGAAADVAAAAPAAVDVGTAEPAPVEIDGGIAKPRETDGFHCWQIEV